MGRPQKHPLTLSASDHTHLQQLIRQGQQSARVIRRAHTLLLAHEGHPDTFISQALHVDRGTVATTRERYLQGGLDTALKEDKRVGGKSKLDNKQQALLIAIACSDAPNGRDTWTMQLLADRLVTLGVVDEISDETVRRALKKTRSSRGRNDTGASRQ
jgi:transposase